MKKILNKNWPFFLLLAISILTIWPTLSPGYFSHHDDLQVMRIFEMKRCILDLQIPCRWVPDMGYGNGYPLFNYYAILPYYIGAIFSFVLGFLASAKLLFAIPLFLGSISMYLLAKEIFGIYPAIFASILYTFAPYRALDTYVRGDVTENFAIAMIPFCFYFALKLIKSGKLKYLVFLSLSLGLFLISHNIMTILFLPVLILIILYWLISQKWSNLSSVVLGLTLGIGLAAFFIFPAYFEKNLVQIDNLIRLDLNFRAHFVTINQLFFDRFWGYGASSPGTNDTISFQIGWPHWWIAVISLLVLIINFKSKRFSLFPLLLFGVFIFSIFMTHVRSAFIWEKIEILKFTQFPWRFLSLSIFTSSLLGAYLVSALKINRYIIFVLVILTIFLNFNFFKPKEFYPNLTDQQKLSGQLWEDQQKAAILDYLPKKAVQPREGAPKEPILKSGDAKFENFDLSSNRFSFSTKVITLSEIEIPIFDFPNWKVFVSGKEFAHSNQNYLGRISIKLDRGDYVVSGKFQDTKIRTISNLITIISVLFLIYYVKFKKNLK